MNKLQLGYQLLRHFGPSWLLFRLRYATEQRLGTMQRRLPATTWAAQPLAAAVHDPELAEAEAYLAYRRTAAPPFFFAADDRHAYQPLLQVWSDEHESPQCRANQLAQGQLRYFSGHVAEIGLPPQWHTNPFSGKRAPNDRHWSELSEFAYGDVKIIWEANRFGFVYDLVRAYWRTGDERYPTLFWQLVENWREQNPPQMGVNWKCGQEASLRLMAWSFGLYGFLDAAPTTALQVADLAQMIAVMGERIEANLSYAISQRNNHGISEAMGLWTIGLLFPEFKAAQRWQAQGRTLLESLAQELIYSDGAFVQHSFNYQRLMLHDYLWAIRLGDLHGKPLSQALRDRVAKAGHFLYQLQDEQSGQLPRYGQNDGALILPLNNCDYDDYRPVLQAISYLAKGERYYADGPWDEDLLWFFGPSALQAEVIAVPRQSIHTASGYHLLRTAESSLFTRCGSYQDRPGQADMLHVDLWWRGHNIALDPGTYSYNAPAPWQNPFAQTAYHNTVTVDGLDQMERVGKFLWLPWVQGQSAVNPTLTTVRPYWEGAHDGYQRLAQPVYYRRAICTLAEGVWLVLDRLSSTADHHYQLHWLLADVPYECDSAAQHVALTIGASSYHLMLGSTVPMKSTLSLCRAEASTPRGWYAPRYNTRQPALSVTLAAHSTSLLSWSLFAPYPCQAEWHDGRLTITADPWQAVVEAATSHSRPLVTNIMYEDRKNLL